MKPLLATLAGFTVSMGMFAGGAALATYTLAAKPSLDQAGPAQDTTALWSAEPRRVIPEEQEFTRISPSIVVEKEAAESPSTDTMEIALASADQSDWPEGSLDHTATSAIGATEPSMPDERLQLSSAHIAWCTNRYRSYTPATNNYTPYSGGQRECVSPHMQNSDRDSAVTIAQANATDVNAELRQACSDRYRSYRSSDNSYQPYGGGPRRQCRL